MSLFNDCYVTGGFAPGTMLNGTFRRADANDGQPTGRIKCGTELSGGFKNIVIGNCVFENCRGFALESVDGGPIAMRRFSQARCPAARPTGHRAGSVPAGNDQ
jgi:polygalacturonase